MDMDGVDFGSHEVIYVTRGETKSTVAEWPNAAIEELLKILGKYYRSQGNDAKFGFKRILYENCSLAMRKKGFKYSAAQCENKWKSLKRRYVTCLNRSRAGKGKKKIPYKKQLFDDEIEYLMQFDKPLIKKEFHYTRRTSNRRRGFDEDMDQGEGNDESDENDQKYTANDERFVQRVLRGSDNEDQKDNIFTKKVHKLRPQQNKSEVFDETLTANNVSLVKDITKELINSMEANTDLLESHRASCEQILASLNSLEKKADKKIQVERKILEQRKIQNTLLAKMLEKLGNSTSQ